jgi:hypothetical protein
MSLFTQALTFGLATASISALGRRSRTVIVFDVTRLLYYLPGRESNGLWQSMNLEHTQHVAPVVQDEFNRGGHRLAVVSLFRHAARLLAQPGSEVPM